MAPSLVASSTSTCWRSSRERTAVSRATRVAPLADLAPGQQVVGVWHLADQHLRQPQSTRALVRTDSSSQGDLGGESLAPLGGRDPAFCLTGRAVLGQVVGDPSLGGACPSLQPLQGRQALELLLLGRAGTV